jgi:ParB family chromosome partitioning protein
MADEGKRKNLGRGLDALLGDDSDTPVPAEAPAAGTGATESRAPIESLVPGRYQPRHRFDQEELDGLADSVKSRGIIQPILVRPHPEDLSLYEIIAGERRWRAAQLAQLHDVPILVKDLDDAETLEIALVENLQRENLSPLEEAEGYTRLINEFSHTQDALGQILGKSRSHVANTLRLLNLPDEVKALVESGELSAGHGRALLAADDPGALAKIVVAQGLNVRQTEKLVQSGDSARKPKSASAKKEKDADTLALEQSLTQLIGLPVTIDFADPDGKITIAYRNLEQLDDILHRLTDGMHGQPVKPADDDLPLENSDRGEDTFPATLYNAEDEIDILENPEDAIAELEAGAALEAEEYEDDGASVDLNFGADLSLTDDDLAELAKEAEDAINPLTKIKSDVGPDQF